MSLRVTLETIGSKEYNCRKCLSAFRGMADEKARVESNLARKFCTSLAPSFVHRLSDHLGQINFKLCPGNYARPGLLALLGAHDAFERGIPPYPGGYFDQPPRILDAFEIIGAWKSATRAKNQRDALKAKGAVSGR